MVIPYHPPPDLFPFRSRWLDLSLPGSVRATVHYVDAGRGRPLLFLHGNPTWCFLFRNVMHRLRRAFRCVALDYPGFGLSSRPRGYGYTPAEHAAAVRAFVLTLDLRDVVVVGHDWGGPIGMAASLDLAPRVSGFVMANTWLGTPGRRAEWFGRLASTPPARWAIRERNALVEWLLPWAVLRPLSDREREAYRAVQPSPAHRGGVAELARQLLRARGWLADLARRVPGRLGDRPVLLPWGMRDPVFRPGDAVPRWKAAFPGAALEPVEEAGHFVHEDAPDRVADAVARYFGTEEPGRSS